MEQSDPFGLTEASIGKGSPEIRLPFICYKKNSKQCRGCWTK